MKFPGTPSLEFSFLFYDTALTPSPLLLSHLNLAQSSVCPAQPDHPPWARLCSPHRHNPSLPGTETPQPGTATKRGEPGPFKSHQQPSALTGGHSEKIPSTFYIQAETTVNSGAYELLSSSLAHL